MSTATKELSFDARQVNGLLEQAECGYHALFDNALIRRALEGPPPEERDEDEVVEELRDILVTLGNLQNVCAQRQFIATLPDEAQVVVVHLYFRFLDQFMQRRDITYH